MAVSRPLATVLAGLAGVAGVTSMAVGASAFVQSDDAVPPGVDSVVATQPTVAMPWGAPGVYGLVTVSTRHSRLRHQAPRMERCAIVQLGAASVILKVADQERTVVLHSPAQIVGPIPESQEFHQLNTVGVPTPNCRPGSLGGVVTLVALRPGDTVLLQDGPFPRLWPGGSKYQAERMAQRNHKRKKLGPLGLIGGAAFSVLAVRLWRKRRASADPID